MVAKVLYKHLVLAGYILHSFVKKTPISDVAVVTVAAKWYIHLHRDVGFRRLHAEFA